MAKMGKHLFSLWSLSDTFSISIGHLIQKLKSKKPLVTKRFMQSKFLIWWTMFPCLAKKHFLSIRLKCKFTIITFLGVAFVFEIIQNLSHVFIYFEIQLYWWSDFMSSTCVKKRLKHEIEIYSNISMLWKLSIDKRSQK